MLNGNPITGNEALDLFGCANLPGRIYDLRKRYNMPEVDAIKKETIPVLNRYGKIVCIARYSLNPEFVKKVLRR
jgi:Helix-turn-helix domain